MNTEKVIVWITVISLIIGVSLCISGYFLTHNQGIYMGKYYVFFYLGMLYLTAGTMGLKKIWEKERFKGHEPEHPYRYNGNR